MIAMEKIMRNTNITCSVPSINQLTNVKNSVAENAQDAQVTNALQAKTDLQHFLVSD
jgi:hypothetical protein